MGKKVVYNSIFLGFSQIFPVVGDRYNISVFELIDGQPVITQRLTTPIKAVEWIECNVYKVLTQNNVYIVKLG